MRCNTAKICFLVFLLLEGTNSLIVAKPLRNNYFKVAQRNQISKERLNGNSKVRSRWLLKQTQNGKELTQITNNNSKKSQSIRKIPLLQDDLAPLYAPPNLSLPQKPSEARIKEFYPLKISDLEKVIESNNPTLKIYREQITQQSYNLMKSIATWYPTIDLSASPQYLEGENYKDSSSDTRSEQWKTTLSVEINWDLIDPARNPEIAAAKATFEKAKSSYLIQLRSIYLEALNTYFLLQKSDEGVRIGKESIKASQISLKDAEARFESGIGTRLEVLEAETQLARDKRLLTNKLGEQDKNRSLLSSILNLPPQIKPIAASPPQLIGIWNASLEESITSALAFREELENIRLDISINNSNANAALALSQPRLSIYNTFSNSYTEGKLASINQDGSSISNTIGLRATWRVFDGGRAKYGYKYNKQISKVSEAKFADQRNKIRQEVETSFYQLRSANQDIASSTREVIAARESLRLARLRFQAGVATQREVVNNQRDLTQAEVGYVEAIANYNTSITKLQKDTGIDFEKACEPHKTKAKNSKVISNVHIESFPVIESCQKVSNLNK